MASASDEFVNERVGSSLVADCGALIVSPVFDCGQEVCCDASREEGFEIAKGLAS